MADHQQTDAEGQLHVALDNMPGALVYTDDDLKIVFCNESFKEMYVVPQELLQPGRPYVDLLRYLANHGYYGGGGADVHVARRLESVRHPSGRSFEDRAASIICCNARALTAAGFSQSTARPALNARNAYSG